MQRYKCAGVAEGLTQLFSNDRAFLGAGFKEAIVPVDG